MAQRYKFSPPGRGHLTEALMRIAGDQSSCKFSLKYVRASVRALFIKVLAGERIHPELIRVVLAGCLKTAALRAVVFTMPSKARGLRIQSSDIILGEPGLGKGLAFQWRDELLVGGKKMMFNYADEQFIGAIMPFIEPLQ